MTFNESLFRALHGTNGALQRWAMLRSAGATDERLRRETERAFGIWMGGPDYVCSGLRFWHGKDRGEDSGGEFKMRKPDLNGQATIDAVRRLLGIPQPRTCAEQRELEL